MSIDAEFGRTPSLGGVPVIIEKHVAPRFVTIFMGKIVAGSEAVVRDLAAWLNTHTVKTSPPCFITDAGELVDEIPYPPELGLTNAHGQPLVGSWKASSIDASATPDPLPPPRRSLFGLW